MLRFYSTLIGENPDRTQYYQPSSKRKIALLANVLFIPVLMWISMGYLVSKVVLEQSTQVAIITAIILGVLIFLIERSILMAHGNGWLVTFRIALGFLTATIGSVGLDEVIFKNDIDNKMSEYKETSVKNAGMEVDSLFAERLQEAKANVDAKYSDWQRAEQIFEEEIDGSGGSNNSGYGPIAKKKEQNAQDARILYDQTDAERVILEEKINSEKVTKQKEAEAAFNDHALLIRIKALFDLVTSNIYMGILYSVVTLFLFFLEFIVVIIKIKSKNSIDEEKELTREALYLHNLELLKERKKQYANPEKFLPEVQDTQSLLKSIATSVNLL